MRRHLIGLGVFVAVGLLIVLLPIGSDREKKGPLPLAQGRQEYTVSTGGTGPKITRVVVDPFDPRPREQQRFIVTANYSAPITALHVVLATDTTSSTYPLTRVSGTDAQGEWEGTWEVIDKHDVYYVATIQATSGSSTSMVDLTFR